MNKSVCLILGAGAGIGGNVAKRFARDGYHACLARRSDKSGLDQLVAEIEVDGGSASGFIVNAVDEGSIEQLVLDIETQIGPIEVAVFNLGAQIGDRGLASTSLKVFELIALKEIYAKKDQLDLSKEFKTRLELVQGGGKNDKSYFPNN